MSGLKIFLLGPPHIEHDGETIRLKNRKATALLAYLVTTRGSHSRDSLINLLWPDFDQSRGRTILRSTLYILTKTLKGSWLDTDRETIGLNADADLWVDVNEFHNLLKLCRTHGHPSLEACPDCITPLSAAVELYRGDFLTGFSPRDSLNFDDWQISQTQSLHSDMAAALERLVELLGDRGELEKATTFTQRLLELDRTDEGTHRRLIELYARLDRRSAALEQYEECVKILKENLGVSPQESTVELYESIKENRFHMVEPTSRKSSHSSPSNLPVPLTSFIGRADEAEELGALLGDCTRLVTLTGPGGTGKTRLGLKVAGELIDHFDDGVFFVSLAPISDPDLVPSAIAHTLGIQETPSQTIFESLKNHLQDKERLLILDNFEQVVSAAPTLSDLLMSCPRLKILATSREVLHLQGEHEFPVLPLALPDPKQLPEVEALSQYEAVELFIQRAVDLKPDFAITNENAPAVAEICHCLDGLPLAIELAASRIKILTPEAILERLSSRMKLLIGGARDLPARQQAMRSTIAWSHDLLEENERVLFRRLSTFVGGFTLEEAEDIGNAEGDLELDILDGVTSLVVKSLLRQEEVLPQGEAGEPRFKMLETIREYGFEQLRESEEEEVIRRRHANFFLALAEEGDTELRGKDQLTWLERLELEHDNLRAALEWSREEESTGETGLRLVGALWWFWFLRGYLAEGYEWVEGFLSASDSVSATARAKALLAAGTLKLLQGNLENGKILVKEALASFRRIEVGWGIAYSLFSLGASERGQGDHGRAKLEEGLDLLHQIGDKWGIANSLTNLGVLAMLQGDLGRARILLDESLPLARETGERFVTSTCLLMLGRVTLYEGDYDRARSLLEEGLTLARELGAFHGILEALHALGRMALNMGKVEWARDLLEEGQALCRDIGFPPILPTRMLGRVAQSEGDNDRAKDLYRESLILTREVVDKAETFSSVEIAGCLEAFGETIIAEGKQESAARVLAAAESAREKIGFPLQEPYLSSFNGAVAALRSGLGEEAFAAAWTEGQEMTLEEVVDYALKI